MSLIRSRLSLALLVPAFALLAACGPTGKSSTDKAPSDRDEGAKTAATAGSSASTGESSIEKSVSELFPPGATITLQGQSPIEGLRLVVVNGMVFFADPEGRYFLNGDMVRVEDKVSLSSLVLTKLRAEIMPTLNKDDAIIFKAKGKAKTVLNVFTDVECGYCRQFHKQISEYTSKGYEVRYYAWPRSGAAGPVYDEMVNVWCSKDKQAALTRAKEGKPVSAPACDNPVAATYEKGRELGINGTPAIFLEGGEQIGGYVAPTDIDSAVENALAQSQNEDPDLARLNKVD